MRNLANISCIVLLLLAGLLEALGAPPPPRRPRTGNSGTSCVIARSKFSSSDLIMYRLGVIGGINSATFNTKSDHFTEVIFGITGGLAAQIIWPVGFVVQPAVMLSQKGCSLGGSGIEYKIDYLEVSTKLMYRLNIADIKPFAFIAPYGASSLGMKTTGLEIQSEEIFSEIVKKYDFGIISGAGFDIERFQLSFKYSWGIGQVTDDPFPIRNGVFIVTAGVFFSL